MTTHKIYDIINTRTGELKINTSFISGNKIKNDEKGNNMIYRNLGNTDTKVSAIGLGTWAIGGGEWWGDSDDELSIQTIKEAINAGINLIDTAPCYGFGKSEFVVGQAIKSQREKVILSTKCGLWWNDERGSKFFEQAGKTVRRCLDPDTIKQEIEISLKRLDTDYIDVYFTHWQSMPPYEISIKDTMSCLMDLKRQGLIKHIGASNVNKENIKEYVEYGDLAVIQEKYSMLDRSLSDVLVPTCIDNNLSIMAYSPLEQGILTGKVGMDYVVNAKEARADIPWYKPENRVKVIQMLEGWARLTNKYSCSVANLVVAWTMAQKGMTYILCGARKPGQIIETAASADIFEKITKEDLAIMTKDILLLGNPL